MNRIILGYAASVAALGWATMAGAQTSPASTAPPAPEPAAAAVQEVVVTAQRRAENLQKVPIAVSVLSSDALQKAGVTSTAGLATITPSLTLSDSNGFLEPRIRGIGNSSAGPGVENSVATYIDGVYISSAPGTLLSLGSVKRVEVLDGPQGTLFGRNAVGGLIQVVTNDPQSQASGHADIGYGNYDTSRANLYVTGPVASDANADLAVSVGHQGDGYGVNMATGDPTYKTDRDVSARSKFLFRPDNLTTVRLSLDYNLLFTSDPDFATVGGTKAVYATGLASYTDPWNSDTNVNQHRRVEDGGAGLRIDREVGSLTLTSITAYRRLSMNTVLDGDESATPKIYETYNQDDHQLSEELQVAPTTGGRLHWIAGLFYFDLDSKYDPLELAVAAATGGNTYSISQQDSVTRSIAAYGQATYEFLPKTDLTIGLRFTQDYRSLTGAITAIGLTGARTVAPDAGSKTYDTPTWRAVLDHQFTDQIMGYVSYNRGYKSGGFNAQSPTAPAYNPEILDAYEGGVKSVLFDHRLRLNAAAFYYYYRNIQVNTYIGTLGVIYNGATAETYGLDGNFDYALTRRLKLTGGVDLLHDRFTNFPLAVIATEHANGTATLAPGSATGNRLPFAPDATASLGVDYDVPIPVGSADLAVNELYSSGYYTQPDNVLKQKSYDMVDGSITWTAPSKGYWVRVWANNILDQKVTDSDVVTTVASIISLEPPRTFGATVGVKF